MRGVGIGAKSLIGGQTLRLRDPGPAHGPASVQGNIDDHRAVGRRRAPTLTGPAARDLGPDGGGKRQQDIAILCREVFGRFAQGPRESPPSPYRQHGVDIDDQARHLAFLLLTRHLPLIEELIDRDSLGRIIERIAFGCRLATHKGGHL